LTELLKMCLRSESTEMKNLARVVWQGTFGDDTFPVGTPPTLADLRKWVGDPNRETS